MAAAAAEAALRQRSFKEASQLCKKALESSSASSVVDSTEEKWRVLRTLCIASEELGDRREATKRAKELLTLSATLGDTEAAASARDDTEFLVAYNAYKNDFHKPALDLTVDPENPSPSSFRRLCLKAQAAYRCGLENAPMLPHLMAHPLAARHWAELKVNWLAHAALSEHPPSIPPSNVGRVSENSLLLTALSPLESADGRATAKPSAASESLYNAACVALTRGQNALALQLLRRAQRQLPPLTTRTPASGDSNDDGPTAAALAVAIRLQLMVAGDTPDVAYMQELLKQENDPLVRFVLRSNLAAATEGSAWVPLGAWPPALACERRRFMYESACPTSAAARVAKSQMPAVLWNTAVGVSGSCRSPLQQQQQQQQNVKHGKARLKEFLDSQKGSWFPPFERLAYLTGHEDKAVICRGSSVWNALVQMPEKQEDTFGVQSLLRRLPAGGLLSVSPLQDSGDLRLLANAFLWAQPRAAAEFAAYVEHDPLATPEQLEAAADVLLDRGFAELAFRLFQQLLQRTTTTTNGDEANAAAELVRRAAVGASAARPQGAPLHELFNQFPELKGHLDSAASVEAVDVDSVGAMLVPLTRSELRGVPAAVLQFAQQHCCAANSLQVQKTAPGGGAKRQNKRPRFPNGLDPSKDGHPDPERWLPKRERSTYKPKKGERTTLRGTAQGVVSAAAAEAVGKPAAASTASIKLPPSGGTGRGTKGGSGQHQRRRGRGGMRR